MANISLKQFVDVYIQPKISREVDSTRKTVVILTNEVDSEAESNIYTGLKSPSLDNSLFPITNAYLKVYFDNGGIDATVMAGIAYTSSAIGTAIDALDDNLIVIAYAYENGRQGNDANYDVMLDVAQSRNADIDVQGINEKIILSRSESYSDNTLCENFAVKYSTIVGAEMTMAAYLSQCNMYGINTIKDYAFTAERRIIK